MKIPVTINNETFNLDEAQVAILRKALGINQRKLSDVPVGETFKLGDMEFIVLEHAMNGTITIMKNFWKTAQFDSNTNNYADSKVRKELNNEFYDKVVSLCGKANILLQNVDLTSDDGRIEYGNVGDYVSLLTCNQYREYVYILDKYRLNNWWWLATAYSTKKNGYDRAVRCVRNDGTLRYDVCISFNGVRPVLTFVSSILVS